MQPCSRSSQSALRAGAPSSPYPRPTGKKISGSGGACALKSRGDWRARSMADHEDLSRSPGAEPERVESFCKQRTGASVRSREKVEKLRERWRLS